MIPPILTDIMPVLRKFVIRHPDKSPYLMRWILWGSDALTNHDRNALSSAFVHNIHTPDMDPHRHNHPWKWQVGLVLSGGYTENRAFVEVCDGRVKILNEGKKTYSVGDINVIESNVYHSIIHVEPNTYTLFLVGQDISDWGFLVDDQHVPHGEYFKRPDAVQMTHSEETAI